MPTSWYFFSTLMTVSGVPMQGWEAVGATHLSVSTGGKVFHTPQEHLDALRRFKHEVGL